MPAKKQPPASDAAFVQYVRAEWFAEVNGRIADLETRVDRVTDALWRLIDLPAIENLPEIEAKGKS
jgi:hypothetical protein